MSHVVVDNEYNCKYPNWCFILYNGNAKHETSSSMTSFDITAK